MVPFGALLPCLLLGSLLVRVLFRAASDGFAGLISGVDEPGFRAEGVAHEACERYGFGEAQGHFLGAGARGLRLSN